MKRIFFVVGELSGDHLAAWYMPHVRARFADCYLEGVGGDNMLNQGVVLHERFEKLNIVGIIEIIKHLPTIFHVMQQLCDYIIAQRFDHVVVVDFPGFNLRLIKKLKQACPTITVTYLSPPQLWCWGAWRIKALKRFADEIIVLYPFEVAWYKARGVQVTWLGNPRAQALQPYTALADKKVPSIALLPGSRLSEIASLLPLFLHAVIQVKNNHPELAIILPLAQSISHHDVVAVVRQHGLEDAWSQVTVIVDNDEKYTILAQCCVALSKPGTVTLELAMLTTPAVVAYKTSWLTYWIARCVVKVRFMSLPNLIADKEIFKELIQKKCTHDALVSELERVYLLFKKYPHEYHKMLDDIKSVATLVSKNVQK